MHPPIAAVIFDADGTLIDSEIPGLDALHGVLAAHGIVLSRQQAHQQFRGVRMAEVVAWAARQLGRDAPGFQASLTAQVRQAMTERFRQGLAPMPGARELLQGLRLPYCIATNGPREKIDLTLAVSGLRPLLADRVYSAYEVGAFKPDPGLFLHAADRLGVPPQHCAVVEDSLTGIKAGLAAGMQVFSLHPREGLPVEWLPRISLIETLHVLPQHLPGTAFTAVS